MSMPPTLYNGCNAVEQVKEVIFQASLAADEKEARDDDRSDDEMDEKMEGDGEGSPDIQCNQGSPAQPNTSSSPVPPSPDTPSDLSSGGKSAEKTVLCCTKRKLTESGSDSDAATAAKIKEVGETPLQRSTRLGGANTGSCKGSSNSEKKKGRPNAMDAFFRAKEEVMNRAAAAKVKEEGRSAGKARGSETGEFLQIYLQLQTDREERVEARAAKESREAHERNL
eukprot:3317835-Rhodomonas_salina.1